MRRLAVACLGLMALTAFAYANGAMGLALEMFEFKTWIVYVIAMLVLEAWMIGRWIGLSWLQSFGLAIGANFFTAFCCPALIVPVLHYAFVGSQANPNPFLNAVALLGGFAFVSTFFESFFWLWPSHTRAKPWIMARVLWAHLVGVPVALLILLIPAKPYVGLEAFVNRARCRLRGGALRQLEYDLNDGNPIQQTTPPGLIDHYLSLDQSPWLDKRDAWTAAYDAEFHRFDTHEMKRRSFELNPAVIGKRAKEIKPGTWLMRLLQEDGTVEGYIIDQGDTNTFREASIDRAHDRAALGYPPVH